MEGYEVMTSDGENAGHVVGDSGGNLIVEHGRLFKSRRALPRAFVRIDDDERVVHATISKQLLEDSPEVEGDDYDAQAVAAHFGLAAGDPAPATEGYGVLDPDDPARTADADAQRAGLETAEQERVRVREAQAAGEGELDVGHSPGATGGDRFRDAR